MITINIDKAKNIAHDIRRAARAEEFKPHDEIVSSSQKTKYRVIEPIINADDTIQISEKIIKGLQ
jgi:hypothetical protein